MPKQIVNNIPGAIPALPVFSQVVISNRTVYVSGSIGCDNSYNIIGGTQSQTVTALNNMKMLLEGVGSGLEHIIKVTVYLSHMARDFDLVNVIYAEFFKDLAEMPARTCIGVAALPMGAFIEVECVAELGK